MLKMGKVDSRVSTRICVSLWIASAILSPRNDDVKVESRICDEKSGLFKDSQGRALGVRNRRESAEIADLSRKAESFIVTTSTARFHTDSPPPP